MKILILTGRFGMGHISAANALYQEFGKDPYVEAKVIDIIKYMLPNMHTKIYKGFNLVAEKYPTLYNKAYSTSEGNFDLSFSIFFLKKLNKLLEEEKPDIIVSTLSVCTKLISSYKKKNNADIPLVTCITDISSSYEWLTKQTNLFLVATDEVQQELIEKGIHKDKILVSGIPVKEQFKQINNDLSSKNNHENNLLIMGGGLGLIPKSMDFYERINQLPNTKTTVITGNNTVLFDKLYNLFNNIEIVSYSNNVHEHMQKATVILSKAGGITLFETIHSELPIVVPCPFLAQEINNANYIEAQGIGKVVWDDKQDLVDVIEDLFSNEVERKKMKCNMKRLKESFIDSPLKHIVNIIGLKEVAL